MTATLPAGTYATAGTQAFAVIATNLIGDSTPFDLPFGLQIGAASDSVIFPGDRSNYLVSHSATSATVTNTSTGAVDTPTNIQTLQFAGVSLPWNYQPTSDFDGDCRSDILLLNASTGSIVEWQLNGSAVQLTFALGGDPAWTVAGTGDFSGSGAISCSIIRARAASSTGR